MWHSTLAVLGFKDSPLRPDGITATIIHTLGLDPLTEIRDRLGRPMPTSAGRPVLPLFG
jgi:hypothetical protein